MKFEVYLSIGNGKNQLPIIKKLLDNNIRVLVIDKKQYIFDKNLWFIKHSIYKFNFNKNYIYSRLKKFKILDVIFRSSGPAVLFYFEISKLIKLKKINKKLSLAIYSKSYLYKSLKGKKVMSIPTFTSKKSIVNKKQYLVIKPDAPIIGKMSIYKIKYDFLNDNLLHKYKQISFNSKYSISEYFEGSDISVVYLRFRDKSVKLLSIIQELNYFSESQLYNIGYVSPPLVKIDQSSLTKFKNQPRQLSHLLDDYYGIFSISYKFIKKNIYIYELNIGLLGDEFYEVIFPLQYSKQDLVNIEIQCIQGNNINFVEKKKFVAKVHNKLYFSKKSLLKENDFVKKIFK